MNEEALEALARELLERLEWFVETDGDTSYISTEEKEDQHHIKSARALIARAQTVLTER